MSASVRYLVTYATSLERTMGWELRKKPLLGERPAPKLAKVPKLVKPIKLPQTRPPKPGPPPPGYEYVWRNE